VKITKKLVKVFVIGKKQKKFVKMKKNNKKNKKISFSMSTTFYSIKK
jgi:hypothetical protein